MRKHIGEEIVSMHLGNCLGLNFTFLYVTIPHDPIPRERDYAIVVAHR